MQGKPMTPLSASMHGVATREQQATMAADVVLLTAEKGRLLARLATYEAALREIVRYRDEVCVGTEGLVMSNIARKALEDK